MLTRHCANLVHLDSAFIGAYYLVAQPGRHSVQVFTEDIVHSRNLYPVSDEISYLMPGRMIIDYLNATPRAGQTALSLLFQKGHDPADCPIEGASIIGLGTLTVIVVHVACHSINTENQIGQVAAQDAIEIDYISV